MDSPRGERNDGIFDAEHDARVRGAVAYAYERIPFYGKKRPKPGSADASLEQLLTSIPLLWKHQIRSTLPKEWVPEGRDVRAELASGDIELVETSGSTAERTRILWDKGWWLKQEERGMRTNATVDRAMGDAARYREAILTTPVCGLGSCHAGDLTFEERLDEHRLFLNSRADPTFWTPADATRMQDELARHATVGLESDPTYLATLARSATREGRTLAVSDFVTLTYAMTSGAHLRAIKKAVAAPVFQLYGASEVGVLFMQGEDGLLHHCPLTTHVELLPVKVATPGAENVALVVVTTLDRKVQPLVRFVVGDLVQVAGDARGRFTPVRPIVSPEGRLQDAIIRPDGAWVTAGAFDRAMASHPGIALYQANQADPQAVVVDVVAEAGATSELAAEVRAHIAPLLSPLEVSVRLVTAIAAESSGKFRIVRRQFPTDLGALLAEGSGVTA
jgi:phenylacetate-coenzyme A ligase PaaK-like adenylate-forming protein